MNKKNKKTNFSKADFVPGVTDSAKESMVRIYADEAIAAGKRTIEDLKTYIYNRLVSKYGVKVVHSNGTFSGMDTANIQEFYSTYTWITGRIIDRLKNYWDSPEGQTEIANTGGRDAQNQATIDMINAKSQVELAAIKATADAAAAAAAAKSTSTISTKTWLMIGGGILLVGVAIFFIKKYKK